MKIKKTHAPQKLWSTIDSDSGSTTADALKDTLNITGGEGIDTSISGDTVTIAGENTTTVNKGIASFAGADFNISAGAVSLADTVVKSVNGDSGYATPLGHAFTITGGEGIDTSGAGATVTVSGENASDTNKGIASFKLTHFSVASGVVSDNLPHLYSITVEDPGTAEDICMGFTFNAITVQEIQAVVVGSGTPSVTIDPYHSTNRGTTQNDILSTGTAITSSGTGQNFGTAAFNDNTIPQDSWIMLETTATGGTVNELTVTIKYTID